MFKNEHMKVSGCFFLVSLNSSKMSVFTSDVVSGGKGRLANTIDMLIIAETKLDETFPNSQFEVENYHLWRGSI
jgi:hypothetical protein